MFPNEEGGGFALSEIEINFSADGGGGRKGFARLRIYVRAHVGIYWSPTHEIRKKGKPHKWPRRGGRKQKVKNGPGRHFRGKKARSLSRPKSAHVHNKGRSRSFQNFLGSFLCAASILCVRICRTKRTQLCECFQSLISALLPCSHTRKQETTCKKNPNSTKPGKRGLFWGFLFPLKILSSPLSSPSPERKTVEKFFSAHPLRFATPWLFSYRRGKAFSVCLGGKERRRAR